MTETSVAVARFLLDVSPARIIRWHTVPGCGLPETVGEHCHQVARIAWLLCYLVKETGRQVDAEHVLKLATIHDYEEAVTGDTPRPYKHASAEHRAREQEREGEAFSRRLDGLSTDLRDHLLAVWQTKDSACIEAEIVSVADKLAALAYCRHQLMLGNRYFEEIASAYLNLIHEMDQEWWQSIRDMIEPDLRRLFPPALFRLNPPPPQPGG